MDVWLFVIWKIDFGYQNAIRKNTVSAQPGRARVSQNIVSAWVIFDRQAAWVNKILSILCLFSIDGNFYISSYIWITVEHKLGLNLCGWQHRFNVHIKRSINYLCSVCVEKIIHGFFVVAEEPINNRRSLWWHDKF